MSYTKRLIEALNRTKKLGLELGSSPLPLKADLPIEVKKKIFQLCAEALNHYGYIKSSDLASKCTPVHLMLQSHLKYDLNIDSYITVGDRYWDDYIYCEMSDESIKKELESPNIHEPVKAHVWLTLSDGTILDCTAEAHADLLFKRGEHLAHECIMLIDSNQQEDAKTGYHRPFVLGSSFLEKTGMVQLGYL